MANTYEVGPDKAYSTIGAVPWATLAPGDVVRIYWRPTPYREKMAVTRSGTAAAPVRVVGVRGPAGERPVIDGSGATTGPQTLFPYTGTQDRGLLVISAPPTDNWGYKPKYVVVEGLEFRGARSGNTFTDAQGRSRSYAKLAAGIFVERGENITVRDCKIADNGNGLFVASGDSEELQSREILVEGNDISGNGNVGSIFEHNIYTEAIGITFQYNDFGPVRPGAGGNHLKDRSAGTVIRYNRFSTAGATTGGRLMDLVEPEESSQMATADPRFGDTYVYGNVCSQGPGELSPILHFGGDLGFEDKYRPRLHFYHNTVAIEADQSGTGGRWRSIVFQLEADILTVEARNNIFAARPATPGGTKTELTIADGPGTVHLGVNWVSPGWFAVREGWDSGARVDGVENIVVGPDEDPGFVNVAAGDLHLVAGSAAIDRGGPLESGAPAADRQYVSAGVSVPRTTVGAAPDLGAFESGTPAPPPPPPPPPPPGDTTPPSVVSVVPASGSTGATTSASVSATFSEAVRPDGLTLTLSGPAGAAVAGSSAVAASGLSATFTPAAALSPATQYTAKVSGAVDLAGNAMADYSWSFTTAAAPPPPPPPPDDTDPVVAELRRWAAELGSAVAELGMLIGDFGDALARLSQPPSGS